MIRNESQELQLLLTVERKVRAPNIRRRLAAWHVEEDDVIQTVWFWLVKHSRFEEIRHMGAYVDEYLSQHVNRIIDREAKHQRNRDQREIN